MKSIFKFKKIFWDKYNNALIISKLVLKESKETKLRILHITNEFIEEESIFLENNQISGFVISKKYDNESVLLILLDPNIININYSFL